MNVLVFNPWCTTQQSLPGASQSAHGHTWWLPENKAVPSSINIYTHLKSSVNIPALSLLQVGLAKSSPASQRAHLHQTKGTICNTDIRVSDKTTLWMQRISCANQPIGNTDEKKSSKRQAIQWSIIFTHIYWHETNFSMIENTTQSFLKDLKEIIQKINDVALQ